MADLTTPEVSFFLSIDDLLDETDEVDDPSDFKDDTSVDEDETPDFDKSASLEDLEDVEGLRIVRHISGSSNFLDFGVGLPDMLLRLWYLCILIGNPDALGVMSFVGVISSDVSGIMS